MNPSTSLGTRSKVGMAKPSPPIRQAGNIWHLLVIRGVCRRSLRSACAHVKYRCRCRVIALLTRFGLAAFDDLVAATVGTQHGNEYHDTLLLNPSAAWHTWGESANLK